MSDKERSWTINRNYLPIKAHFFFLFGSMGATIPFMQIFAKDLGISATAVGVVFTAIPICIFLAKPIFGLIADFFRNIKIILIILIIVTSLAFLAVLHIHAIKKTTEKCIAISAHCMDFNNQIIIHPPSKASTQFERQLREQLQSELKYACCKKRYVFKLCNIPDENINVSLLIPITSKEAQICSCFRNGRSFINCQFNNFQHTSRINNASERVFVYTTYNFWLYALLSLIATVGAASMFSLSDTACYEILGENPELYGRQRLWASVSWGFTNLVAGYLNDVATSYSKQTDYSPGFYLMLVFIFIDLVIISRMELTKTNFSTNICKDISKIFASWEIIVFSFGVYIFGALTGFIWTYQFWYLTDLGATQTLLGLSMIIQSILEVPLFFYSDWFIVTFGYFQCLIMTLAAFALRTGIYVLIKNPWMSLPVEFLHAFTYATFYTAMISYAAEKAPPGTEATMIGVLGGLSEGLGYATGSLLGGIGIDTIGGEETFFIASMFSTGCVFFFTVALCLIKRASKTEVLKTLNGTVASYGSDGSNSVR